MAAGVAADGTNFSAADLAPFARVWRLRLAARGSLMTPVIMILGEQVHKNTVYLLRYVSRDVQLQHKRIKTGLEEVTDILANSNMQNSRQ